MYRPYTVARDGGRSALTSSAGGPNERGYPMSSVLNLQRLEVEGDTDALLSISLSSCDSFSCNK
jgi:hypothetical protein